MAPSLAALLVAVSLLQSGSGQSTEYPDGNDVGCDDIRYSWNTSPENKTVLLVVGPVIKTLDVTLFGAESKLSCTENAKTVGRREYNYTLRIVEGKTEKFIFPNVASKYYCATVRATIRSESCIFGTDTKSHPVVHSDPEPPPESKGTLLMILGAGICLFLVVIFALLLSMKKPSDLLVVPSDDSDAAVDAAFFEDISTALLLYARDSAAFLNLMSAFRDVLVTAGDIQVLDPLDRSRFEEVARNPSGWLSRELVKPRTKVIIVVSDVAILRQRALLSNLSVQTPEQHFLDGIFTQALRHLHDNPYDSSNYSRIFTVRFDDVMTLKENLSLIVPLRCFNLPRHMAKLICEVKGLSSDQFESVEEELLRSPTLARLQEQLRLAESEKESGNEKCYQEWRITHN